MLDSPNLTQNQSYLLRKNGTPPPIELDPFYEETNR